MDAAVIEILQQAGSQDPNILKPAEQTLENSGKLKEASISHYITYFPIIP